MVDLDEAASLTGQAVSEGNSAEAPGLSLVCPVRGRLKVSGRTKDGLTPSEEARRVDAIHHLLSLGYDPEHILIEPIVRRLGNGGRNSLRADLAITDEPAKFVRALPVEDRVKHCIILGEIKRDNSAAKKAKETQVEPLLAFGPPGCLAFYWDDVDRRVFWQDRRKNTHEGYLAALPARGEKFQGNPKLTYRKLQQSPSLVGLFNRIDDTLHAAGVAKHDRYDVILMLLLAKLYDERMHVDNPDMPLEIQDTLGLGIDINVGKERFDRLLETVSAYWGSSLRRPLPDELALSPEALGSALELLAPQCISAASHSAMQDFFMRFARDLYKWDMAQYFTPTPLTEYIVELANPRAAELVKDPAVGSGDFLMAAADRVYGSGGMKPQLFGADLSETAVQVAELNKLLHSANNTTILVEDTLANIEGDFCVRKTKSGLKGRYHLLICNPPFGSKIVEKNPEVLGLFDLGYEWKRNADTQEWEKTEKLLKSQEKGILFLEACVRQAMQDGGRVAIIVPNGYLGNRRDRFAVMREWMLRETYLAAIISFPRFTFKTSGADVSASVLLLERRATPLESSTDTEDYPIAIELIERVGWDVGQKKATPLFVRDEEDGTVILGIDNEPMLDADFEGSLARLRASKSGERFPWLAGAVPAADSDIAHCISIKEVLSDPIRCIDPKRYSKKVAEVRNQIKAVDHFRLGDVLTVVPQMSSVEVGNRNAGTRYRYIEIQDTGPGIYSSVEMRGWQLPARARHLADPGDVFVGGIWGSVGKWFVAGSDSNTVVTNGFHRMKVEDERLVDVLAGLCSEAFSVQARAFSRGSDGLAEVTEDDLKEIVLPIITDLAVRKDLESFVDRLVAGQVTLKATVEQLTRSGLAPYPHIPPRPSHVVLV